MLDKQKHEYYLKRILRDIASQSKLSTQLVFKGGTCLYFFYDLPRFSVDLDFNLVSKEGLAVDEMNKILGKYLQVEQGRFKSGKNGWLWEASYEKGLRQMQVDVSKRQYPDEYEVKQFYGLSVRTLAPSSLFAHKLCAILDRKHFQNRDLFDSWFMFENMFDINEEIVKTRTGKTLPEYLHQLEIYIGEHVDSSRILQGLGELLDEKQKQWIKTHLVGELLAQIQLKRDSL